MLNLVKQRWFQVLIGILLVFALFLSVYFWGKSNGRKDASTKFDQRQSDLLKKSQEADARADMWKAKADASEFYASKLNEELLKARKTASLNQKIYEEAYTQDKQEIDKKYENEKNYINSDLSACERCRDLCERFNRLSVYPEFANRKCDASAQCDTACQ